MNRIWIKWMKRTIQLHSVAVKSIYISFNISFWTSWYCAMISKEYSLSISLNGFTAIKTFDMYSWRKKKREKSIHIIKHCVIVNCQVSSHISHHSYMYFPFNSSTNFLSLCLFIFCSFLAIFCIGVVMQTNYTIKNIEN